MIHSYFMTASTYRAQPYDVHTLLIIPTVYCCHQVNQINLMNQPVTTLSNWDNQIHISFHEM